MPTNRVTADSQSQFKVADSQPRLLSQGPFYSLGDFPFLERHGYVGHQILLVAECCQALVSRPL